MRTGKLRLPKDRKIRRRTPVYDHAGVLLYEADRAKALELLENPNINVGGTARVINSFRFAGPDPAGIGGKARGSTPIGKAHKNETYFNPAGVFTFDFIPSHLRPEFERVLRDRGAVAVLHPSPRKFPMEIVASSVPSLPLAA